MCAGGQAGNIRSRFEKMASQEQEVCAYSCMYMSTWLIEITFCVLVAQNIRHLISLHNSHYGACYTALTHSLTLRPHPPPTSHLPRDFVLLLWIKIGGKNSTLYIVPLQTSLEASVPVVVLYACSYKVTLILHVTTSPPPVLTTV